VKIGENAILYPNVTILDVPTKILYYGLGLWSESVVTLVIALYIPTQIEQMDLISPLP
jgi:hypothetical protein